MIKFNGIKKKDGTILFVINNIEMQCPDIYNKTMLYAINNYPNKVTKLFSCIINENLCTQDIIDYNMDTDINWNFIKNCISISKTIETMVRK